MIEAARAIEQIQKASGSIFKEQLLKRYADTLGVKEILYFIYNPYLKTGISTAKLSRALLYSGTEPNVTYLEIMEHLRRHNTGSDADLAMAARFINCTRAQNPDYPFAYTLAKAIVTQDLQIGMGVTSLNKVFGSTFIPKIGVMLGTKYGDIPARKLKWPYIVTEKLDGIRRVIVKENGICRCYSRSGLEDTGLVQIMEDMKHLPDNMVYDGELLAEGVFRDSIALRQATNSIAATKGQRTGLTFNIFDMIKLEEFKAGQSKDTAITRKVRLAATLMDESAAILYDGNFFMAMQALGIHQELLHVAPVPILGMAYSLEDVTPLAEEIWAAGGEGVMLNSVHGLYEIKRSKELVKLKKTEEFVLKVIDMQEGTNKYEDMLGALVVEYKGNPVGVGSGFSDAQRQSFWDNPDKVIGRYIEVESFGESTNAAGLVSLNCPIFMRFVDEVHE